MILKIRLKSPRRKTSQCCPIVVTYTRRPRDGCAIENIGLYSKHHKHIILNRNRLGYWLSIGATLTNTTHRLLSAAGELPR